MPNQFFSPEGDLENYFVTESWLIDQYIGDTLWTWGRSPVGAPEVIQRDGKNWVQASSGIENVPSISAIKSDGTLWTWGYAYHGQLGNATKGSPSSFQSTPVTTFAGGTNWKQVSSGFRQVAAIKSDGTLWTWGQPASILGRQVNTFNKSTPVTTFAGGTNWADTATTNAYDLYTIASGSGMAGAIKTDGTLWIWGTPGNQGTSLGINVTVGFEVSTPVTTFAGGTNWKQISFGQRMQTPSLSMGDSGIVGAIKTDGTLWVWGNNNYARLGTNNTRSVNTPVTTFAGGTNWRQLGIGYIHMAAIKTDGTLWTWGNNGQGQLGSVDAGLTRNNPVTTFAGGTNWADTATTNAYDLYTMALTPSLNAGAAVKTDGTLWVWGLSAKGQLGLFGDQSNYSPYPTKVTPVTTFAGGTNWKQVAMSAGGAGQWTAAIKTDGTLWTWGNAATGKLGNSVSFGNIFTPATTFSGGTNWRQVCGGYNHMAAIKTDGTLWTWGSGNSGRLGNGQTTGNVFTPITTFAGGTTWNHIDAWGTSNLGGGFVATKTDGTLWGWGNAIYGCLGATITTNRSTPVTLFAGGTNWKQISVSPGGSFAAAVKTDGTLWTWGNSSSGQLGNATIGFMSTPVTTFAGGTNWKQVSCDSLHVAAVKTDGTLWTWGYGSGGRLGTGDATGVRSTPVTTSAGGTSWNQVFARASSTIATRGGVGNRELLGFGSATILPLNYNQFGQFNVSGTTWIQVSCGHRHTAAIKTDGTLWTWGNNTNTGMLGIGDLLSRDTPVTTFAGGTDWKQVSCGYSHTAAVKTGGTLWTWGYNSSGQLGNAVDGYGSGPRRSTPVTTFAGGTNWKQVGVGRNITQAVKTDGTLWVWGNNSLAAILGNASTVNVSTPTTTFAGGTNWKQVAEPSTHTALALNDDGVNKRLFVWGNSNEGRLGSQRSADFWIPIAVSSTGTWKQVSSGRGHMAAIKTDGTLWIWGSTGGVGRLGGSQNEAFTPVTTFAGGTDWKQVSCGDNHTSAVKTNGTLWIWGSNAYGQLGNAIISFTPVSTPITTFAGGTNWKQVSCGDNHTAAVKTNGTLWIWGNSNYGQLGNTQRNTNNRSTPVTTFAGGTNWKQVDVGYRTAAATKTDGTLWTWGNGFLGQLGTNDTTTRSTPVTTFTGGTNWKQVSAGRNLIVAVTSGFSADLSLL